MLSVSEPNMLNTVLNTTLNLLTRTPRPHPGNRVHKDARVRMNQSIQRSSLHLPVTFECSGGEKRQTC